MGTDDNQQAQKFLDFGVDDQLMQIDIRMIRQRRKQLCHLLITDSRALIFHDDIDDNNSQQKR
jgi:hypothetical protein